MDFSRPRKLMPLQLQTTGLQRLNGRIVLRGSIRKASKSSPVYNLIMPIRNLDRMQDQPALSYSRYHMMQRLGRTRNAISPESDPIIKPNLVAPVEEETAKPIPEIQVASPPKETPKEIELKVTTESKILTFFPLSVTNLETGDIQISPLKFLKALLCKRIDELALLLRENSQTDVLFSLPDMSEASFNEQHFVGAFEAGEQAVVLLKPEIAEHQGEIIRRLEGQGLVLHSVKLETLDESLLEQVFEGEDNSECVGKHIVVICVEGPEISKTLESLWGDSETPGSIISDLGIPPTSFKSSQTLDQFKNDGLQVPIEFLASEKLKVSLPYVQLSSDGNEVKKSVPLGLLARLYERGFEGWSLLVEESLFTAEKPPPKKTVSQTTSSLKVNSTINDNPIVLSLHAPKLVIYNETINANYPFKINDIKRFVIESEEQLPQFAETLRASIRCEETQGLRKKISVAVQLPETTENEQKFISFDIQGSVEVNGAPASFRVEPVKAEIYNPLTSEKDSKVVPPSDLLQLIDKDFSDWESLLTSYFS